MKLIPYEKTTWYYVKAGLAGAACGGIVATAALIIIELLTQK